MNARENIEKQSELLDKYTAAQNNGDFKEAYQYILELIKLDPSNIHYKYRAEYFELLIFDVSKIQDSVQAYTTLFGKRINQISVDEEFFNGAINDFVLFVTGKVTEAKALCFSEDTLIEEKRDLYLLYAGALMGFAYANADELLKYLKKRPDKHHYVIDFLQAGDMLANQLIEYGYDDLKEVAEQAKAKSKEKQQKYDYRLIPDKERKEKIEKLEADLRTWKTIDISQPDGTKSHTKLIVAITIIGLLNAIFFIDGGNFLIVGLIVAAVIALDIILVKVLAKRDEKNRKAAAERREKIDSIKYELIALMAAEPD